jgi:Na+:H+ antiporter, NhaC family
VFTLKKVPPFLAILGSALFAGILACFTQWDVVKAFVDEPGRSTVGTAIKGIYAAMATGFVRKNGNQARLIAAVNGSGIGLNVIAGDLYVADVLSSRRFTGEFERRGLAPEVLSRAVEDSGTVTSVLLPWNTCGAYISGVLGVSTASYFPYCFFNLASPILDVVYGFIGFKVPSAAVVTPEPNVEQPPTPTVRV